MIAYKFLRRDGTSVFTGFRWPLSVDAPGDAYTRMCADRAHELALGASPPLEQWDAIIEPSVPEGAALLGFIAARIGEERGGPDAYHAERGRQTAWLVERLGL